MKHSLEEYEKLHESKLTTNQAFLEPKKEFLLAEIETKPESRGQRRYVYNE